MLGIQARIQTVLLQYCACHACYGTALVVKHQHVDVQCNDHTHVIVGNGRGIMMRAHNNKTAVILLLMKSICCMPASLTVQVWKVWASSDTDG